MKKITKEYELYEFEELNEKAKEKAIEEFNSDTFENEVYWEAITDDDGAFEFNDNVKLMLNFFGVKPSEGNYFNGKRVLELFSTSNDVLVFDKDITKFEEFLYISENNYEPVHKTEEELINSVKKFIKEYEHMSKEFIIGEFEAREFFFEKDGTKFEER